MALISWDDSLSIGIPSIDGEHKQLIAIINRLFDAMSAGKANDILSEIFNELLRYTGTHFAHEVNLFKLYKYPQADSHKNEHDLLVKQVSDLQTKFKAGTPVSTSTANFLKGWLTNHILKSDKAYSAFLIEKGVK